MDLNYAAADESFRERARAWLQENAPKSPRPAELMAAGAYDRAWQRKLHDGGFAGLNWPKAFGGRGLSVVQQMIWFEEVARARAPALNSTLIGLQHGGPTLIVHGSDAQKAFHLPRILSGESIWCQGFSEPGAGSDLAALRTRGTVEGDELVVNGQKMWTSFAHFADYQELLVRTDPDAKRHAGLSWVICDMKSPGISIQPIKNMMGETHVNMVFYDDVRIPLSNVVGGLGNGWKVAMSTLSIERALAFLPDQIDMLEKVERLTELARRVRLETGKLAIDDDEIRRKLGRLRAETLAMRAMTISNISGLERDGQLGPEGSIAKLFVSTGYKALSELAGEILGYEFLEYGEDRTTNRWTFEFMWSWVLTIAGGSSEIQREIIADTLLQLPRAR